MPLKRMILATSIFAGLLGSAPARAASPTLESVVPAVGPRGGEFSVVLTGGRFKDAREILFYEPGLSCRGLEVSSDNEIRATLKATDDCRIGAHPFRLRTPGGLSELKVLHVTPFPVAAEVEPNDDPGTAQTVGLNTTVSGVMESADFDWVSVALRKGQRLSAEVEAIRLGGEMTDMVLTVFGPDGRQVAAADDCPTTRQDPFVSFLAPREGRYTIQLRDTSFGGGPSSTYALHVGDFPRPNCVFPPGAQAGKEARLSLMGLDGSETLTIPAEAGPWWDYFPSVSGSAAPTPTLLRVRPYPGFEEPDLAENAPPAPGAIPAREWPVAFHGVIGGRDDVDAFAIRAHPGETIQAEVFAERVGSPLDSILQVYAPDGGLVGRSDDDDTHDGRLVFRAEVEGDYRVEIGDKRRKGGPEFVYRIELEEPRPSLTLFLPGPVRKSQARQVIAVPRGNRITAYVGVRREGFDAPVEVEAGALPPGVALDLKDIPAGNYLVPVVIEAAPDAPLGASLVPLKGRATTSSGTVLGGFEQLVNLIPGTGDSSYQSVGVGSLAVVVTEEAPYRVSLSEPKAPLARDGSIELVATVERAAGFDEAVEVSLPYLPPGVEMEGPGVVPSGQSTVRLRLFARPDADPVSWRLAAEARPAPVRMDRREMTTALMGQLDPAAGPRRRRASVEGSPYVASKFVPIELAPAPVSGRFTPASTEQGKVVTITCALESTAPHPGKMTATLEGLPPRAEAKPVEVETVSRGVEFQVKVGPTTPVGEHDTLVCVLTGAVGGQPVVYRVGRGGQLKVAPAGALATDANGKPLSPLEALRRKEHEAAPVAGPKPGTLNPPGSHPR